jgi:hypothetical protein
MLSRSGSLNSGVPPRHRLGTTAAVSGTEEEPARTYLYDRKGLYGLSIEVIWTGRFELFDAAGLSLGTYPLDPYIDTETIGYQVIEIRSILTK